MINSGSANSVLISLNAISATDVEKRTNMENLATAQRINKAGDDAAGLSSAAKLRGEMTAIAQGIRNIGDFGGFLGTADKLHAGAVDILQNLRTLTVQAANGTNSTTERASLNVAAQSLLGDYRDLTVNGNLAAQFLLDGSFQNKQLQIGGGDNSALTISIDSINMDAVGRYRNATESTLTTSASTAPVQGSITANEVFTVTSHGIAAQVVTQAGMSAKQMLTAIRSASGGALAASGVQAHASTNVQLSALNTGSFSLSINGKSLGSAAIGDTSNLTGIAEWINKHSASTGVLAKLGEDRSTVNLLDTDGDNIQISNFASTNGARIGLQAIENGYDGAGGINGVHFTVLQTASSSTTSDQVNLSGFTTGTTVDMLINGVQVRSAIADSSDLTQLRDSINAASDASGVQAVFGGSNASLQLTNAFTGTVKVTNSSGNFNVTNASTSIALAETRAATITGQVVFESHRDINLLQTGTVTPGTAFLETNAQRARFESFAEMDLTTYRGAEKALSLIDHSLSRVIEGQGRLGATQNTLDSLSRGLGRLHGNLQSSHSYIMDADMAKEVASFAQSRILSDAAQAMLQQGIKAQSSFLSLLR